MTLNGKYASNRTCRGLNKISVATKNTLFGLIMKKLWPSQVGLSKLAKNENRK